MTPQEFEKIAIWMGWEKRFSRHGKLPSEHWVKPNGPAHVGYSLTNAECIEALNRLVEKGYKPKLWRGWGRDDWGVECDTLDESRAYWGPTINQAVEQALLKLIEAEGPCTTKS